MAVDVRILETADVDESASLGSGTTVWQLAQVRENATIGSDCIIGRGAYVDVGVRVGANCKVQNYSSRIRRANALSAVATRPPSPVVMFLDEAAACGIDLAVLAAPSPLHEPFGLQLARLGVPTLIEKPLAEDSPPARKLSNSFATAGVAAAVGHIERFNPVVTAWRAVASGDHRGQLIGELREVHTCRIGPMPERPIDSDIVNDLLMHDIALVHWLLGCRFDQVQAQAQVVSGRPCADEVIVRARLNGLARSGGDPGEGSGAASLQQRASRLASGREWWLRVDGSLGNLLADLVSRRLILIQPGGQREIPVPTVDALSAELAAWCHLVRTGERDVLASLEDGVRTATVADAVLREASAGATITVEGEAA